MDTVKIKFTGTTPLLMHNPRLSDKRDPIAKEMSEITKKKTKMTESERDSLEDLEFMGGLYYDKEIGVYVETIAILRTIQNAAMITRQGKDVLRAMTPTVPRVPLIYSGPRTPEQLIKKPEFRYRASVGNQKNRIMRTRPMFRDWSVEMECYFLEDAGLSKSSLPGICSTAGRCVGLLDGRVIGFGRFTAEVSNGSV